MSPGALALLVLACVGVGLVAGMMWATWDMRSEPTAKDPDTAALERRVRIGMQRSWDEHPAVITKRTPYDRTREDDPI